MSVTLDVPDNRLIKDDAKKTPIKPTYFVTSDTSQLLDGWLKTLRHRAKTCLSDDTSQLPIS
jgi:hypothetical protein